jgi:hypothetical protein
MKNTVTILFFTVCSIAVFAQSGSIISLAVSPASPTTSDFVKVYANLEFSSGSCMVSNQGLSTVGHSTNANAIHCLGMLAFICSATDTFNLGYLPSGGNAFHLTLNVGSLPSPCTPGIVPADTGSVYFNVTNTTGVNEFSLDNSIVIYPNPVTDEFKVESVKYKIQSIKIKDILGQTIQQLTTNGQQPTIDMSGVAKGIYFAEVATDEGIMRKKFIKE